MKIVSSQSGRALQEYIFRLENVKYKMFRNIQRVGYNLPVKLTTEIRRKITWASDAESALRIIDSHKLLMPCHKHHIRRYAKFYHAHKFLFDTLARASLKCISRELTGYEKLRLRLKYSKQLKAMRARKKQKGDAFWI